MQPTQNQPVAPQPGMPVNGEPSPQTEETNPAAQNLPPPEQIVNYRCPNCAGPLTFGIESQEWECHFCNSNFAPGQLEQMEAAIGTEKAEDWHAVNHSFDKSATAYTCPSCGGTVITDKNTASTFCPYCHNPTVIAAKLTGAYKPAMLIPFQKTKEQALAEMKKHAKSPFMPPVFRKVADAGEISGLYVPYWLYSSEYNAMMHASGTRVRTWRDSRYIYTKTDHYRVERGAHIPIQRVPVDASKRMDDKLMDALEPFDYSGLAPFSMQYLSGHHAESYDENAAQCSTRFEQRAHAAIESTLRAMASGYSTTHVHNIQKHAFNQDVTYAMLPVWTLSAEYKGKVYTYAMNGQTGKMVGKLPISWARVGAWFGALFAAASIVCLIGGMLLT